MSAIKTIESWMEYNHQKVIAHIKAGLVTSINDLATVIIVAMGDDTITREQVVELIKRDFTSHFPQA